MYALPPELIENIQEYVYDFHYEYNVVLREMHCFFVKQILSKGKISPKYIKGRHVITY